jgi:exonuclease III
LQETEKNKHWLRVKGWKKVFQSNESHKLEGVVILISDKVNFRLKSCRRDNDGHFILMKGTIHQKEISILNIYMPNELVPIYIKKSLIALKPQMDTNTVIVGDLSPIHRSSRQKFNKQTSELLCTLDQIDMVDVYIVFHPKTR